MWSVVLKITERVFLEGGRRAQPITPARTWSENDVGLSWLSWPMSWCLARSIVMSTWLIDVSVHVRKRNHTQKWVITFTYVTVSFNPVINTVRQTIEFQDETHTTHPPTYHICWLGSPVQRLCFLKAYLHPKQVDKTCKIGRGHDQRKRRCRRMTNTWCRDIFGTKRRGIRVSQTVWNEE
jgi:hypothetical protein